jgi:hypothetical protein
MLRIERSTEGGAVRIALSGRVTGADLMNLERTIAGEAVARAAITLDLGEVRLVDREAVRFLVKCDAAGMRLANCPAYVREWMSRERKGSTDEPPAPAS